MEPSASPDPFDKALGPLETAVMEVIWTHGKCNVKDVTLLLTRPLAYTTVMTTLDRLFRKGVLDREKRCRQFVYWSRLAVHEWRQRLADRTIGDLLSEPDPELIVSHLVKVIADFDPTLLDGLEARIRERRRKAGT